MDQFAMTPSESVEAFRRLVCGAPAGQMIVATGDLQARLELWIGREPGAPSAADTIEAPQHPRPTLGIAYAPPTNDLEHTIAATWQELLGVAQVGIHDNFFELGGNSLIGLKVIARLKKALGMEIPIVALFEGPTVAALAQLIGQDQREEPSYEQRRGRGERRKERTQQKQGVAEAI
jgi:acyl carrier protein